MNTQAMYERNERARVLDNIAKASKESLEWRRMARAEYTEALKDPELLADLAQHLFNGNCGFGELQLAQQILKASKRANKVAQLGQLIAVVHYRCPGDFASYAWNNLSKAEQAKANKALADVIYVETEALKEGE